MGQELIKPGNDSTDSECGEHGPQKGLVVAVGVIAGVLVPALIIIIAIAIIQRKKKRDREVSVTLNKHVSWLHIH